MQIQGDPQRMEMVETGDYRAISVAVARDRYPVIASMTIDRSIPIHCETNVGQSIELTKLRENGRRNGLPWAMGVAALALGAGLVFTPLGRLVDTGFLWSAGCALPTILAVVLFQKLRHSQIAQQQALSAMVSRSSTLDRLLDFSQTIQGAGKPEQIYSALGQFLRAELKLSAVAVLAHEPDTVPATTLKATLPADFFKPDCSVHEMELGLCPCLRQNLPRQFRPDASPVRCSIDAALGFPPALAAYCVPFTIGRKAQVMVHMLLPAGETWTEQLRQLAQTYVNAASSSLVTMHHLSEAEKQSLTDALTGLYNRRSLDTLLQREIALAERHALPLSIIMIDLDKFKEINDSHGHAAGDHLLKALADCVRMTVRKTDMAFRYGGDEFVIALPQATIEQAQQVAQKLRQAYMTVDFSDAIAHLEQQPTLSIGAVERCSTSNLNTLISLLGAADAALYDAKKSDRNCIRVYTPPQAA
jgi:diguanylate cyclase (GGDEF)-like protein